MADLFLLCLESIVGNYADDNSPFACECDDESVLMKLTNDTHSIINWYTQNGYKANPDKFHFLASSYDIDSFLMIEQNKIYKSNCEKLLGIRIDHNLSFEEHVSTLCRKAGQKLHALGRISHLMTMPQRILVHFGYCLLVWMFHSRRLNNRINNIHERALRIVFNDYSTSFQSLLLRDNSVTIHIRNIQNLAIELFKVAKGFSPKIMKLVLPLKESTRYPTKNIFQSRNMRTSAFGLNSLSHLGPKIWAILPEDMINLQSLEIFKKRVKQWNPTNCPCKLCIPYITNLGYVH